MVTEKEVFPSRQNKTIYEELKIILERCNEPTSITKLYYHLESSYTGFKKIVSEAVRLKLIQKTRKHYILTPKGVEYLCKWRGFLVFLKGEE